MHKYLVLREQIGGVLGRSANHETIEVVRKLSVPKTHSSREITSVDCLCYLLGVFYGLNEGLTNNLVLNDSDEWCLGIWLCFKNSLHGFDAL